MTPCPYRALHGNSDILAMRREDTLTGLSLTWSVMFGSALFSNKYSTIIENPFSAGFIMAVD